MLQKELVAKRLNEIAPLKGAAPVKPAGPVNPNPNPSVTQTAPPPKPGEWIDLLEWSEGVDWAPRGIDWNANVEGKPTKAGITIKGKPGSHFPLPAIIEGNYELQAEFTRTNGVDFVMLEFPVGIHRMQLETGNRNDWTGLHFINGKLAWMADADKRTLRRPSLIINNKRHRLAVRVMHDSEEAQINVDLDDVKDYLRWNGKYTSLTNINAAAWSPTMVRHAWLGGECSVTFHSAKIRMLSGSIQRDVITAVERDQDFKNGFVRLVGEKAIAPKVGWAQFLVNQIPLDAKPGDTERLWPLITRDFKVCDDFYGALAPSRLKCPIPTGAKSFSVIGYNDSVVSHLNRNSSVKIS